MVRSISPVHLIATQFKVPDSMLEEFAAISQRTVRRDSWRSRHACCFSPPIKTGRTPSDITKLLYYPLITRYQIFLDRLSESPSLEGGSSWWAGCNDVKCRMDDDRCRRRRTLSTGPATEIDFSNARHRNIIKIIVGGIVLHCSHMRRNTPFQRPTRERTAPSPRSEASSPQHCSRWRSSRCSQSPNSCWLAWAAHSQFRPGGAFGAASNGWRPDEQRRPSPTIRPRTDRSHLSTRGRLTGHARTGQSRRSILAGQLRRLPFVADLRHHAPVELL